VIEAAFQSASGPSPLRLLVVDESELDFELLVATLERERFAVSARRVSDRAGLRRALADTPWDVVISDYRLADFSAGEVLAIVRAEERVLPFIVVSESIGEENAAAAIRDGADDYLVKGRLARLAPALLNALSAAQQRRARLENARALADSERRLHELLAHRDAVVEETRAALAREIHDEIGGTLSALHFDLAWIARNGDARSANRASLAMDTLARVMQCAQRIQRDLRPPVLDDGLIEALRWQIDEFRRRTGLHVEFDSNVDPLPLTGEAAMTVFRTLQESLTNIAKHARASLVCVDLVVRDGQLSLEIADDGVGIGSQDLGKPASFGLRGLAERARRVEGWIDVAPGARGGTCVLLSMPMPAVQAPAAPIAIEA